MSGGVLKRLWGRQLVLAGALLASVVAGLAFPVSAASTSDARALPRVMPPSYYGMREAERDDGLLRDTVLGMHNDERQSMGLSPLAWDDALAAEAALYAEQLARTNIFRHSARTSRATASGENLWMGARRLYGYQTMIGSFLDERRLFRTGGKMPDVSVSGRWEDVGHYTQIIWRGTRKVGCAVAEGQSYDFLVCRYFPAGNIFGMGPLDRDPAASTRYARDDR